MLVSKERVVLTFQYPPHWSATECMLSILSTGDDDYLMDGRRLEEQIALSNPLISSWNSKPFIYRHIDTWSLGDVATPFSCSPHQDVIVELSCRGINCIAEFRETDRAGKRRVSGYCHSQLTCLVQEFDCSPFELDSSFLIFLIYISYYVAL